MNTAEFKGLFPSIISNSLFLDSELDKAFNTQKDFLKFSNNCELQEQDAQWNLEISLPGSSKDSVLISIREGNKLLVEISNEKDRNCGIKKKFIVPPSADADLIRANMKDGLLTIEIPKKRSFQDRTINIS